MPNHESSNDPDYVARAEAHFSGRDNAAELAAAQAQPGEADKSEAAPENSGQSSATVIHNGRKTEIVSDGSGAMFVVTGGNIIHHDPEHPDGVVEPVSDPATDTTVLGGKVIVHETPES